MTVSEMIAKYRLRLVTSSKGEIGVQVMVGKPSKKEIETLRAVKDEIIKELQRRKEIEDAKRAEEKAVREAEYQAILNGEILIKVRWCDGEYLSGYEVFGSAAKALETLGLAEHVSGWGHHVDLKVIEALGKEFTFAQAEEYSRPARETKAAKIAHAQAKRQAKFDEAKTTGKPVLLERYSTGCNDPKEECSLDIISVYVTPDGKIKEERQHTW